MSNKVLKKIAAITSHPIQYQAPLFRAISQQSDIDLTVYFGCDYGSINKLSDDKVIFGNATVVSEKKNSGTKKNHKIEGYFKPVMQSK